MRVLLFLLLFIYSATGSAQRIVVHSTDTNTPIKNVVITNKTKSHSTKTDIDGLADITVFNEGELLYISHTAYISIKRTKSQLATLGHKIHLDKLDNDLSEVIISISKWEEDRDDIVQKTVSITPKDIALYTPQTAADALASSGQVYIQRSQLGGGSPIIRGFSTNRLLLTVDGVRMNTAIFRGGNVQNVLSIDPFTINHSEVILGPGSVVYGSDAIGGVLNFYTPTPKLYTEKGAHFSGNAIARFSSANEEKTGHVDFSLHHDKWAAQTHLSYTDFEDLKMGSHGPEAYLRNEYIQTIDGTDTIIQNKDPEEQLTTGYHQINILQKVYFEPNDHWNFTAGIRYSTTSDYNRYDRLTQRSDENLRFAEWFYGPQRWFMGNIKVLQNAGTVFYDKMKITAAYQNFEESRNSRIFGETQVFKNKENVDAYSLNLDFEKKYDDQTSFYYGGEYILNTVHSKGSTLETITNTIADAPSRYPDGASWQSSAVYGSVKHRFGNEFRVQAGLRYNHIRLTSTFDTAFFDFPFTEANVNTEAVTGTLGLNWFPSDILQWKVNFSTAFRAPNVDDIGKIFDSEPGAVVVPNPDLESEYAYNGEVGVRAKINDKCTVDLATYYTYLDNALIRKDFNLNGETELLFNGELSTVQAIQNASNAKIYGFEAGIAYKFSKYFSCTSRYTVIGGREQLTEDETIPSRHVVPQFGDAHLIYTTDKWTIDFSALYNGTFDFQDLSPSEQSKTHLYAIDTDGNPYSPSWYTLNIRSQYQITNTIQGTLSIENITDQRYRTYSSGISAAGRNLILSLKYSL